MAVSLVSTGVQFPDSTIQTTAAAAGGTTTGTASGSISAGATTIVNSNGTFGAVSGSGQVVGTPVNTTNTSSKGWFNTVYDSSTGKTLMFAANGNNTCGLYVLTVSGSTVSIGAETLVTGNLEHTNMCGIGSGKFIIYYNLPVAGSLGYVAVATISGTTVSLGTPVSLGGARAIAGPMALVYNPSTGTAFAAWQDGQGAADMRGAVLSVSGSTITVGTTSTIYATGNPYGIVGTFNSAANTPVIGFAWSSGGTYQWSAVAITMSGTTFTAGSIATGYSGGSSGNGGAAAYNATTGQLAFAFYSYSGGYNNLMIGATQSGTTITFGTASTLSGVSAGMAPGAVAITTLADSGTFYIMNGLTYLQYSTLTINVSTLACTQSAITQILTSNGFTAYFRNTWDSTNKKFINGFWATSGQQYPGAVAFNPPYTNVSNDNFIGLSTASYTNGQTATITVVGGVNTSVTGLSPGRKYYVQNNGSLSTTPDSPSVVAGIATASNKLLVKG